MEWVEMICLANSRKYGGRCIAGLRCDGGGWVRPVGPAEGTLYAYHYRFADKHEADIWDKIRVPLEKPLPRPYQKENFRVAEETPWELVERPASPECVALARAALLPGPDVFGCARDRVHKSETNGQSLALVYPKDLRFRIITGRRGQRQARALFTLRGACYDLSLTDPVWEARLADLPIGEHKREAIDVPPDERLLLTLSLGEPYEEDGFCYKIVAAVVPVPPEFIGQKAAL